MTSKQFTRFHYQYQVDIRKIARKIAGTDREMYEELYQEGLITMWKLKVERIDSNESAYVRQAVKFGMINYLRSQGPIRYMPLSDLLRSGYKLYEDEDGPLLVSPEVFLGIPATQAA